MKSYRFYVLSRNTYISVIANCKWDAAQIVLKQFNTFKEDIICVEIFRQPAFAG